MIYIGYPRNTMNTQIDGILQKMPLFDHGANIVFFLPSIFLWFFFVTYFLTVFIWMFGTKKLSFQHLCLLNDPNFILLDYIQWASPY